MKATGTDNPTLKSKRGVSLLAGGDSRVSFCAGWPVPGMGLAWPAIIATVPGRETRLTLGHLPARAACLLVNVPGRAMLKGESL